MAKKVYIGVNNVARKVKKIYIGVGGVARKVKKGYIGVNGVARPFWTGGEVEYYGKATALSASTENLAGVSVGNYALFGGGQTSSGDVNVVTSYSNLLVKGIPSALNWSVRLPSAARTPSYALIGYGNESTSGHANILSAYNASLTKSSAGGSVACWYNCVGVSTGKYAVFGGGNGSSSKSSTVRFLDNVLTANTAANLTTRRTCHGGASVNGYTIFAGGQDSSNLSSAEAYDSNMTKVTTVSSLSSARTYLTGGSTPTMAIFVGGGKAIEGYNGSLVKSTTTDLNLNVYNLSSTNIDDVCVFAGGTTTASSLTPSVCTYTLVVNPDLTRKSITQLEPLRTYTGAASVGSYFIFAGGLGSTSASDRRSEVDVYTI